MQTQEQSATLSPAQFEAIADAMRDTYFKGWDPAFLDSDPGRDAMVEVVERRYNECVRTIVPWIQRVQSLAWQNVVEIGCGSGASTSGLSWFAGHIDAYDIDAGSIEAASRRAAALGQTNITLHVEEPSKLFDAIERRHPSQSVDVVLLYAVMEHQHVSERIDTLKTCWRILRPGGILVVVESPNRLAYFDEHTALLPFFNMIPTDLAVRYARFSPRELFPESIAESDKVSREAGEERLARWGRGVSFHEFQIAIQDDLSTLVVGDGYDPEIVAKRPVGLAERCLYTYWLDAKISVPIGFVRVWLDLILRKPGGDPLPTRSRVLPIEPLRVN